jgi:hypothetical protein
MHAQAASFKSGNSPRLGLFRGNGPRLGLFHCVLISRALKVEREQWTDRVIRCTVEPGHLLPV